MPNPNGTYEIIRWESPSDPFADVIEELKTMSPDWAVVAEKNTKHHASLQALKTKYEAAGCEATVRSSTDTKGPWVTLYVRWRQPKRGRPAKKK